MSPESETRSLFEERVPKALAAAHLQSNRRPGQKPSQRDIVLDWLLRESAVCATSMFKAYIPRAGSVIHKLRKAGYEIETRPCSRGHDHQHPQVEYVLHSLPVDPRAR